MQYKYLTFYWKKIKCEGLLKDSSWWNRREPALWHSLSSSDQRGPLRLQPCPRWVILHELLCGLLLQDCPFSSKGQGWCLALGFWGCWPSKVWDTTGPTKDMWSRLWNFRHFNHIKLYWFIRILFCGHCTLGRKREATAWGLSKPCCRCLLLRNKPPQTWRCKHQ